VVSIQVDIVDYADGYHAHAPVNSICACSKYRRSFIPNVHPFEGGAETVKTKLVLDDGSTLNEWFGEETYQFRLGRMPVSGPQ
jgi:hypothetical protein